MRRVHLAVGAVVVVAFLLTGQFMDRFHKHLEGMPEGPRMLYRTRHVFILMSGLVTLGVGAYLRPRVGRRRRACQLCGSALLMVASALFIAAFFYEPGMEGLETPLSHWGAYAIVAGVALHLFGGLGEERGAAGG